MSLTKDEIEAFIEATLTVKVEEFQKKLADQERRHQSDIKELLERLNILERDNIEISKELEETSKVAHTSDQYIRRNNIELTGIPHELDDNLEDVCINLINSIIKEPGRPVADTYDDIGTYDIEGCHRLRSTDRDGTKTTIVRFTNRKVVESIMENRKKIKELKMDDLGDSVSKIYVNDNLSQYNNRLAAKCRRLKKKREIKDTWTTSGIVRIKLNDNSIKVITHKNDLDKLFPNFVYFD